MIEGPPEHEVQSNSRSAYTRDFSQNGPAMEQAKPADYDHRSD